MTRTQAIDRGRIWQVSPDSDGDKVLFEGTKTACIQWLKATGNWRLYKTGLVRLGRIIIEF